MFCALRRNIHLLSRIKLKHVFAGLAVLFIVDFFGVFTHIFEESYHKNFKYPYEGDIHEYTTALRHGDKPLVPPINGYNYSFIHDMSEKCMQSGEPLRLVILVKSAIDNFHNRMAIRHSWGFEKRFSDVNFKIVFLLGTRPDDFEVKTRINLEAVKYQDVIQIDYLDTYYNNTIKTMMGFKWATTYCLNSKFYMFVDDDMYLSVKNVLRFLRNPVSYPDYLKEYYNSGKSKRSVGEVPKALKPEFTQIDTNEHRVRERRQVFDIELSSDVRLFAGYVFVSSPHRHKSSKWYISLKEYPYDLWPPYVTAGAFILSKEALLDMYFASFYTKHFRFDDIYLGIVAKKAEIEPFHCDEFHFYKKEYTKYNYKYVISSHGYNDPEELLQVWNEQKAMGNA